MQARLKFKKETGAVVGVCCREPVEPIDYWSALGSTDTGVWKSMVGNSKKWKEGVLLKSVLVRNRYVNFCAERLSATEGMTSTIAFSWDDNTITFADILATMGELPISPHSNRATQKCHKATYLTVYPTSEASVAAPTAGSHCTKEGLLLLAL